MLWLSFSVATVACSGSLRDGHCSELECLDGADTQLCGLRNKCFYGFGKQRLILGFDMPGTSFIDYCSIWSLRIILGATNQSWGGGTNFFFFHCPFILLPLLIFFLWKPEAVCVCTGYELQCECCPWSAHSWLQMSVGPRESLPRERH